MIAEGRPATAEEQQIIARFGGWGNLPQLFDMWSRDFIADRDTLRELLTDDEWAKASASTINAHYTDGGTVREMWAAVGAMLHGESLGRLRVLEPAVGIGNFIGLMPPEIRGTSQVTAIELDAMTGKMAGLLYPGVDMRVAGFEDVPIEENSFEVDQDSLPF